MVRCIKCLLFGESRLSFIKKSNPVAMLDYLFFWTDFLNNITIYSYFVFLVTCCDIELNDQHFAELVVKAKLCQSKYTKKEFDDSLMSIKASINYEIESNEL